MQDIHYCAYVSCEMLPGYFLSVPDKEVYMLTHTSHYCFLAVFKDQQSALNLKL